MILWRYTLCGKDQIYSKYCKYANICNAHLHSLKTYQSHDLQVRSCHNRYLLHGFNLNSDPHLKDSDKHATHHRDMVTHPNVVRYYRRIFSMWELRSHRNNWIRSTSLTSYCSALCSVFQFSLAPIYLTNGNAMRKWKRQKMVTCNITNYNHA